MCILRKTKKDHYANLDEKDVADNKQFWKTVKPLLSNKVKSSEKITLVEGEEIVTEDGENAEIFNKFFSDAVKNLKVPEYQEADPLANNISHPIFRAMMKFRNYSSVIAIKNLSSGSRFDFCRVNVQVVEKEISRLSTRKATQYSDLPVKILKENSDIFGKYICDFFKECVDKGTFPSILKHPNITPVFKKEYKGSKDNYRSVSILPVISKIFEKLLCKQITVFIDPLLSKFQCGFRKGCGAQDCLLAMLEYWKSEVDKGKVFGALLTDLSKAFDCLSHELIIAKLNAYGFSLPALKLVQNYLSERQQRTKINQSYSLWEEILFGLPQGSILGPILFNIFLSDLFLVVRDVNFPSYADDNTIYQSANNVDDLVNDLQLSAEKLFRWFSGNQTKGNTDKCHLIMSINNNPEIQAGDSLIKAGDCEKLLDLKIDYKLNFDNHVNSLCKKANNKLRAQARATPYMNIEKNIVLMNSFFNAQFNYCPRLSMLHSRCNNNKIKHLHERCLRLTYCDKTSSYEELLQKDGSLYTIGAFKVLQ